MFYTFTSFDLYFVVEPAIYIKGLSITLICSLIDPFMWDYTCPCTFICPLVDPFIFLVL